jgi:hypothetical protein
MILNGMNRFVSLWQPWASAMFTYEPEPGVDRPIKTIETRNWELNYIPPGGCWLGIHAAKHPYKPKEYPESFARTVTRLKLDGPFMPYGAVLGFVWLLYCKKADELVKAGLGELELMFGNYVNEGDDLKFEQRYGWVTDPFRIKILRTPYPLAGKQGVFYADLPKDLEFKER